MHINKVDPIKAIPLPSPLLPSALAWGCYRRCLQWWATVISLVSSLTSARVWVISGSASERENGKKGERERERGEWSALMETCP